MIDMKRLREAPAEVRESAAAKGVEVDVEKILDLDKRVRSMKTELENIAAQKNDASKRIATAAADERKTLIDEMRMIDRKADELKAEVTPAEEELMEELYRIPNPALPDVKIGASDKENEVIKTVGEPTKLSFTPKDHMELGEALDIIDKERGAKTSGARFAYMKGDGARLGFALTQYALDVTARHGFIPVTVPHMVTAKSMRAMGYLEHGGHDEIYYLQKDNLYLIGTSEQAIGPMHQDEILDVSKPIRYVGVSACYRREAGSYGKDTKGILRMHQFDKVEMFSFVDPEISDSEHELLLSIEEELMQGLGIPYHVIKMCTGDLGLPAARKYDIEAWIPSQETYRETHSTSTTTDFQARRLNTRFKGKDGKNHFVHALNGTAFAIGRTIVAILENFQNEDGTITIPEKLRPYMGGQEQIKPRA